MAKKITRWPAKSFIVGSSPTQPSNYVVMFMLRKFWNWIRRKGWQDHRLVVTLCPICRLWIENGEDSQKWYQHLLKKHRATTLEEHGFDVELLKYLAGENPEYGKPIAG